MTAIVKSTAVLSDSPPGQRSGVPQQNVDTMQPGSNSDSGSSTMQTTLSVLTVIGPPLPKSITSSRCAIALTCPHGKQLPCPVPVVPCQAHGARRIGWVQGNGEGRVKSLGNTTLRPSPSPTRVTAK
jgi:hypothetical protein